MDRNQVILAAAAFAGIWVAAHFVRAWLSRLMDRRGVRKDMALLVNRTVYFGLLGLALFVALATVAQQFTLAFNGVLVAAILTGLGLQDLAKNYVSGFYILFERNVKVGETIKIDAFVGTVTDVKMRVTYLRGVDGELIVIPNNELFSKTVSVIPTDPEPEAPAPGPKAKRTPRG